MPPLVCDPMARATPTPPQRAAWFLITSDRGYARRPGLYLPESSHFFYRRVECVLERRVVATTRFCLGLF